MHKNNLWLRPATALPLIKDAHHATQLTTKMSTPGPSYSLKLTKTEGTR